MPPRVALAIVLLALAGGACSAPPSPTTAQLQVTPPAPAPPPPERKPGCGRSPGDWCTSAADGPCGAHPDQDSCRADARCEGAPYRGESLVACTPDGKGFWTNCPAVGCVERKGAPAPAPGEKH
jgi:hypothetical protein